MKRKSVEFIWIYLVVCVLYGLFALLLFFPFHPITTTGWIVWFLAALPVSMAGEAVGAAVFNKKSGETINPDTDHLSAGRIGYGVVVTLILLVVLFVIAGLLDTVWGEFWTANFSSDW